MEQNPKVKCVVDSCTYYAEGDLCSASTIEIRHPKARTKAETDCVTFHRRGK